MGKILHKKLNISSVPSAFTLIIHSAHYAEDERNSAVTIREQTFIFNSFGQDLLCLLRNIHVKWSQMTDGLRISENNVKYHQVNKQLGQYYVKKGRMQMIRWEREELWDTTGSGEKLHPLKQTATQMQRTETDVQSENNI